jgi:hypothetical protein
VSRRPSRETPCKLADAIDFYYNNDGKLVIEKNDKFGWGIKMLAAYDNHLKFSVGAYAERLQTKGFTYSRGKTDTHFFLTHPEFQQFGTKFAKLTCQELKDFAIAILNPSATAKPVAKAAQASKSKKRATKEEPIVVVIDESEDEADADADAEVPAASPKKARATAELPPPPPMDGYEAAGSEATDSLFAKAVQVGKPIFMQNDDGVELEPVGEDLHRMAKELGIDLDTFNPNEDEYQAAFIAAVMEVPPLPDNINPVMDAPSEKTLPAPEPLDPWMPQTPISRIPDFMHMFQLAYPSVA